MGSGTPGVERRHFGGMQLPFASREQGRPHDGYRLFLQVPSPRLLASSGSPRSKLLQNELAQGFRLIQEQQSLLLRSFQLVVYMVALPCV